MPIVEKTLYDILEISRSASPDAVRAAYERLIAKCAEYENSNGISLNALSDVQLRSAAIKDAFLILGNSDKRRQYDQRLSASSAPTYSIELPPPFWTFPRFLIASLVFALCWVSYYRWQDDQEFVAEEKLALEEKAKNEARQAEQARLEAMQEAAARFAEDRQKASAEMDTRRTISALEMQSRLNDAALDAAQRRQLADQRAAENRIKMEELQATQSARVQAMKDRIELCRREMDLYGKSSSCY